MSAKKAAQRWETLVSQEQDGQQCAIEKMELVKELRAKMKEYHEALLLQSRIAQLNHPQGRVLTALRHFCRIPFPIIHGKAKFFFLDNQNDLVAVKSPAETDYLSDFLRRHLGRAKEAAGNGSHFGRFNESTITTIVTVTTICAETSFLLGPILGLYFLRSPAAKLVLVVVFTAMFAATLSLITNTRRAEVFGATAAYVSHS